MIKKILKLIYPWKCPGCGKLVEWGFCEECKQLIEKAKEPCCEKCGKPLGEEWREYCYDCQKTEHEYEKGRALWVHEGVVKKAVYDFKYKNRRIYAEFFAEEIAKQYGTLLYRWKIDEIIPIPVSRRRKRERGYNQAELLVKELEKLINIQGNYHSLVRIKDTKPQKKLNAMERKKNLSKAFLWKGSQAPKRNILLVDDIYTTGNTIDSAAAVLKKNGALRVYFLTVNIGQGY